AVPARRLGEGQGEPALCPHPQRLRRRRRAGAGRGDGKLPAGRRLDRHPPGAATLHGRAGLDRRPLLTEASRPRRILITNDDGIDAPGIALMQEIAAELCDDVWVVAPDGNQSGASHRFTFGRELSFTSYGHRRYAVTGGSPADCVVAGMTHLCADLLPDL